MLDSLVAILLVELLDKVYGVIGVEKVDEVADLLRVHPLEHFLAVVFIKLHEHVGLLLIILNEIEKPFRLPEVKRLKKLRYVGGMQLAHLSLGILFILLFNKLFNPFYVSIRKFLHNLQNY